MVAAKGPWGIRFPLGIVLQGGFEFFDHQDRGVADVLAMGLQVFHSSAG
jgi:hypothetical protein